MLHDAPPPYRTLVFDCDSTLSAIEGIDELGARHRAEISALTERAMSGELALEAVYAQRLELVRPTRADVLAVGKQYVAEVLPHARELVLALRALGKRVCVVSGGLEPAVRQLACTLGVDKHDVFSVAIRHDAQGAYAGFDDRSPLARSGGKIDVVRALARESGPVALVGDGITDLETALVPDCATRFVAYGGVVRRAEVLSRARHASLERDLAALLPLLLDAAELAALARMPEHAPLVAACRALGDRSRTP